LTYSISFIYTSFQEFKENLKMNINITLIKSGGGNRPCDARQPSDDDI